MHEFVKLLQNAALGTVREVQNLLLGCSKKTL